jgi:RecA/RadA recombinase
LPKRIYEVYGESGTGKTQFAIQLLLNVSATLLKEKFSLCYQREMEG